MTLAPQLPSIAFETVPRPLDVSLPRMDVCGFVGFASAGPVDVPVLVEDAVSFRNVFGADPVLARRGDGSAVHAHLGPAVEAFFANGGARAWIVRVAATGPGGARTNRFTLPGLLEAGAGDGTATGWRLVAFPARAPGSWSDAVKAAATLEVGGSVAVRTVDDAVVLDHGTDVTVGDLLRLDLGGELAALVTATRVASRDDGVAVGFDPRDGWVVDSAAVPADAATASRLTVDGSSLLADTLVESVGGRTVLAVAATEPLAPGDMVALEHPGDPLVVLTVGNERLHPDDPDDGRRRFVVDAARSLAALPPAWTSDPLLAPTGAVVVEVQRVRLAVDDGLGTTTEVRGLGVGASHPRSIRSLPGDQLAFTLLAGLPRPYGRDVTAEDVAARRLTPFELELIQPRFPLASPGAGGTLLPLGVPTDPMAAATGRRPAETTTADPATRNGLATYDAAVFVDPDLAGAGADTVVPLAYDLGSIQSPPRRLRGVHALVTNDDVTLVCVPDAVHTGWDRIEVTVPPPLVAPVLSFDGVVATGAHWSWTAVPDADVYELQVDATPAFGQPLGSQTAATTIITDAGPGCPADRHARVRARRGSELGPWSNVATGYLSGQAFVPCLGPEAPTAAPPEVAAAPPPQVLWRARTPAEADPWLVLRAVQTATLRWCAGRGDVLAVLSVPRSFTAAAALSHIGVLRNGAPSFGDDGLPVDAPFLAGGVPRLTEAESGVLGHGAIFHPWPVIGWPGGGDTRAEPPDGVVSGSVAARSIERGAWVAPARRPFRSVVALSPTIGDADALRLSLAGVNPIAQDPSGFMSLTMSTMTDVTATRPVNVRRLLMLLRRLARREGAGIVFEPHDEELRHLVRMRFERLLTEMYRRGAFAGATAAEAFEVSTGRTVNPPESVDTGRFVVEVRVAPSRPLEHLTVRLVLGGGEGSS